MVGVIQIVKSFLKAQSKFLHNFSGQVLQDFQERNLAQQIEVLEELGLKASTTKAVNAYLSQNLEGIS